jgi:hypothetical protein
LRRLIALCASAAFCLLVAPVFADWSRVQLNGVSVCKDSASGVTFKPPYSAKADVTKACNTLTSFLPWLGTAEAAPVLTHTVINPDGTHDTAFRTMPRTTRPSAGTTRRSRRPCPSSCSQNTGTATDINLLTYCTGTGCASATYTLVTAVTGWSIGGSGSSHLLNSGASAGSSVSLGSISLKVTNGSSTDTSASFNWSYIVPPVPAVKWHPGYYFDCSIENRAGEAHLALGNAAYTTIKSCIDFASTQTNVKGVFVLINWASLEGNTLGSYDGSVASGTGAIGTIGYPLIDDLLTYASGKSLKVILGLQWGLGYYDNCGTAGWSPTSTFPAYLVQSSCTGGTDASNTYGVTLVAAASSQYIRLWKAAATDRLIALGQAYGTRYDGNAALEKWIWYEQDPSFLGAVGHGRVRLVRARDADGATSCGAASLLDAHAARDRDELAYAGWRANRHRGNGSGGRLLHGRGEQLDPVADDLRREHVLRARHGRRSELRHSRLPHRDPVRSLDGRA